MTRIAMERAGEMEVFARVVDEGGFSAAARALDLTPSAVSKLVARLEARLGSRLLHRTTRALTLTDEGEAYYRAALPILRDLDDAEAAAAGGSVHGRLRINATVPFGNQHVVPAILSFRSLHPRIEIELALSDAMVDLVAERVDVAIRMGDLPDSSLMARRLGQSRRVVCASPAYLTRRGVPEVPGDLAGHDCLTFSFRRAHPVWPFRRGGQEAATVVAGGLIVNNGETMKQMALAGAGIIRVGLFHVARELAEGRLVPLLEDWNPGDLEQIHAVYVGGGHVPRRVRAFIDHLAMELADDPVLHGRGL